MYNIEHVRLLIRASRREADNMQFKPANNRTGIYIAAAVIIIIIALALYGYLTGAWDQGGAA
jgi:hypothetical protein